MRRYGGTDGGEGTRLWCLSHPSYARRWMGKCRTTRRDFSTTDRDCAGWGWSGVETEDGGRGLCVRARRRTRPVAFVGVYFSLDNYALRYVHSATSVPPHGSSTLHPQCLSALASASTTQYSFFKNAPTGISVTRQLRCRCHVPPPPHITALFDGCTAGQGAEFLELAVAAPAYLPPPVFHHCSLIPISATSTLAGGVLVPRNGRLTLPHHLPCSLRFPQRHIAP
ncbi:hypothetical protein B0H14DRAFT_500628 [Mycena olivaceomarginata]|nr:hypothetical protein B0H14DRAFT_500628 [Mycena olivaceomarginata]